MAAKKPDLKAAPRRGAAKKPFDMRQLWRAALWGLTAFCALLLAVLTSRSEVGAQRMTALMASLHGKAAPPPFDAQAETRKLANQLTTALRSWNSENDQLRSRLAAVEHHVDDVSGSLTRQIEAVKAEEEAPRPADTPPVPTAPDVTSSVPSSSPAPSSAPPAPAAPLASRPSPPSPPALASVAPKQYAVDIGSASSIQALRARWSEIRTAHPQLFQGLTPTAVQKDVPPSGRPELRLVLGPLPNSDAAARLCASLVPYRLACQPTGFDGQHVALQ